MSSLAYLKDLSVNYLKIDGSFVRDAITNTRCESMIKAIAQLAKVMCMETIAEYVETDVLRARMADLGVDYGQGFAMGKAQPLEELLRELAIYEATVNDWDGGAAPPPPAREPDAATYRGSHAASLAPHRTRCRPRSYTHSDRVCHWYSSLEGGRMAAGGRSFAMQRGISC